MTNKKIYDILYIEKRKEALKMTKAIYFDMDGTITDLYSVHGWLENLQNFQTKPYREAKALLNMRKLARVLNRLQKKVIISA